MTQTRTRERLTRTRQRAEPQDPLWYKDAIIYQVHIKSFFDSDGDGIGDLAGLTQRLDYIHDLGVTAIWLLPFYPSPLRDDGYDIAHYTSVHSSYGTMRDFTTFMREANRCGLQVITELVINHTSDQHPWFQRARRAPPGSPHRDYYVWSDTPDKYKDARIIFQDFETSNWTWDPVAGAYYWHRFYSHQPDLNFANPQVLRAVLRAMDFWMAQGVSGMRLDAIPYLFERDGTTCENLPETHEVLRKVRRHLEQRFHNRMLLAEANQWPEDAVAYFGQGDECHMSFHFPVMPRMFMALRMEDRFPLVDIFAQTPPIPENCQWAMFLRNHDELTLEMVTDEERDYMYRLYAQDPQARINLGIRRRLAPLMNNDRRKIELMMTLLYSLPGAPVMYYGDEIGMGDNFYLGDRNGVRTPMQWNGDRNGGFSRANPQKLYLPVVIDPEYHYEAINVEAQQGNPDSLLWWTKRLIAMRKRYRAFSRGSMEFLNPDNRKVLAFLRRYQDEVMLVVVNLSRIAQHACVPLPGCAGRVPVELIGRTEFPLVSEAPYFFTLGPYTSYWFSLDAPRGRIALIPEKPETNGALPTVSVQEFSSLFDRKARHILEALLLEYIRGRRWFGGKARTIQAFRVDEIIPIPFDAAVAYLAQAQVEYAQGEPETYLLPVTFAPAADVPLLLEQTPHMAIARLRIEEDGTEGILHDALANKAFCEALLHAIGKRRTFRGEGGELLATHFGPYRESVGPIDANRQPAPLKGEQSNTSIIFGDRCILKLYRRPGKGINPELEVGRFLTERVGFPHIPPVIGALEYRRSRMDTPTTLGVLQGFVQGGRDAWGYTQDALAQYFEQALAHPEVETPPVPNQPLLAMVGQAPPTAVQETMGYYLESARLLAQRTGEMHLALAFDKQDEDFAPEPFTTLYQRAVYQAMRGEALRSFQLLSGRLKDLPPKMRKEAERVLAAEERVVTAFSAVRRKKINAMRIRVHGDLHLGQVLHTNKDFVIIDFEGEPSRPASERRLKRSPLRDVAVMLRSFHYASFSALQAHIRQEDLPVLQRWAQLWDFWVSATYLNAYLKVLGKRNLVPDDPEDLRTLLDAFVLSRAMYELDYELNNRPAWLEVPLQGILQTVEMGS